ncbi:hypothetical protein WA026_018839 [Henosepilachna vigintioctopunctata]|uniref:SKI-interacting protein SKIP SNW domain-containing protein n=1 Tax=Henosepilachna vigintioctopunctata TaxID=420089 RepID=A0AAW1TXX9_9CUCU
MSLQPITNLICWHGGEIIENLNLKLNCRFEQSIFIIELCTEALNIAHRKAVETRAQLEKKLAQKEKEQKEENLRQLAQRARNERAGIWVAPTESKF